MKGRSCSSTLRSLVPHCSRLSASFVSFFMLLVPTTLSGSAMDCAQRFRPAQRSTRRHTKTFALNANTRPNDAWHFGARHTAAIPPSVAARIQHAVGIVGDGCGPVGEHSQNPDLAGQHVESLVHIAIFLYRDVMRIKQPIET